MRIALVADPAALKMAAAATSVVSGASAAVAQDWTMAVFGVPVFVLLASFAGSVAALSFLQPMGVARMASSVCCGTAIAAYIEPIAAHYLGLQAHLGVAFAIGLVAMAAVPLLITWVPKLLDAVADRVRGGAR